MLNGPYESYYENGQLYEKTYYIEGEMNGSNGNYLYESYSENGDLKERF